MEEDTTLYEVDFSFVEITMIGENRASLFAVFWSPSRSSRYPNRARFYSRNLWSRGEGNGKNNCWFAACNNETSDTRRNSPLCLLTCYWLSSMLARCTILSVRDSILDRSRTTIANAKGQESFSETLWIMKESPYCRKMYPSKANSEIPNMWRTYHSSITLTQHTPRMKRFMVYAHWNKDKFYARYTPNHKEERKIKISPVEKKLHLALTSLTGYSRVQ